MLIDAEPLLKLKSNGFSVIQKFYSDKELVEMIAAIERAEPSSIDSKELYAIRELINQVPELSSILLNENLKNLLGEIYRNKECFLSKAIYFDKPANSNWFVPFHQDLTINVCEKNEISSFKNWTNKRGQIGVQPPTEILERTTTIRIHIDDTDEKNGALRVLPRTHTRGVFEKNNIEVPYQENLCDVKRGGVMLMKPLIFHASSRSQGISNRRVIHLEFCDKHLPEEINWKEKLDVLLE